MKTLLVRSLVPLAAFALAAEARAQCASPASPASIELVGQGTPGTQGIPRFAMAGAPIEGLPFELTVVDALPSALGSLLFSTAESPQTLAAFGVVFHPAPPLSVVPFRFDVQGASPPIGAPGPVSPAWCGLLLVAQAVALDPAAQGGAAFTQAVRIGFGSPGPGGFDVQTHPVVTVTQAYPSGIAIADVNGDQVADLVTSNSMFNPAPPYQSDVSVLLGLGDGSFAAPQTYTVGPLPRSVAVGDLDGDLVPDIAATYGTTTDAGNHGLSVLLGLGDGTFAPALDHPATSSAESLRIADLDGDQVPDLVASNFFATSGDLMGEVSVFLGIGDGSFALPMVFPTGGNAKSVAVGDLDGDLIPDLAVANAIAFDAAVLLGLGDGTFGPPQSYPLGPPGLLGSPQAVAIGDLDGDEVLDVAVTVEASPSTVAVLLGSGDGTLAPPLYFPVTAPNGESMAIGDVNGDQVPDVVTASQASFLVSVLPGLGDGTLGPEQVHPLSGSPRDVTLGDLDGDLVPDLVATHGSFSGIASVSVLRNLLLAD